MKEEKEFVKDVIMVEKVADFYELSKTVWELLETEGIEAINTVEVIEDIELSEKEYRNLTSDFLRDNNKMFSGKGGIDENGVVRVIRIACPNLKTFFVDPEGHNYARLAGLSLSDIISHDAYLVYKLFANKIKGKENEKNK
jgi:hypothetical protein